MYRGKKKNTYPPKYEIMTLSSCFDLISFTAMGVSIRAKAATGKLSETCARGKTYQDHGHLRRHCWRWR